MARERHRLDRRVFDLGLAPTGEKARALVMAGRVRVNGRVVDKPGSPTPLEAAIECIAPEHSFVGRGGQKLAGALAAFHIAVAGRVALDLGSSTGGFTDCLLQAGALRVYAIDVGRGLIDSRLRADSRVHLREGVNARELGASHVPEPAAIVTADLAFISLRLVLPAILARLAPGADVIVLVKPQFELGRGEVGRGVVRDPTKHRQAIETVATAARALGLITLAIAPSPITGAKGNREFFLHLREGSDATIDAGFESAVALAVAPANAP